MKTPIVLIITLLLFSLSALAGPKSSITVDRKIVNKPKRVVNPYLLPQKQSPKEAERTRHETYARHERKLLQIKDELLKLRIRVRKLRHLVISLDRTKKRVTPRGGR